MRTFISIGALAALALSALAAGATAAEPERVTVVMTEYTFKPDHVVFQHGHRYRLHLQNSGGELHEFTAAAFFKTAKIENPDAMNADRTDVVLQPHESKDIILTPNRKGTFALVCADHDWEGMIGTITVK